MCEKTALEFYIFLISKPGATTFLFGALFNLTIVFIVIFWLASSVGNLHYILVCLDFLLGEGLFGWSPSGFHIFILGGGPPIAMLTIFH